MGVGPRHREALERRRRGDTLHAIGTALGTSRERARQMIVLAERYERSAELRARGDAGTQPGLADAPECDGAGAPGMP